MVGVAYAALLLAITVLPIRWDPWLVSYPKDGFRPAISLCIELVQISMPSIRNAASGRIHSILSGRHAGHHQHSVAAMTVPAATSKHVLTEAVKAAVESRIILHGRRTVVFHPW